MTERTPIIGLMLGDMTGIGPEISAKLLGFNKGVTVTAGLKTVFTTPAHGTAFDIVGEGRADPGALEHALRIAAKLAAARRREDLKLNNPRLQGEGFGCLSAGSRQKTSPPP